MTEIDNAAPVGQPERRNQSTDITDDVTEKPTLGHLFSKDPTPEDQRRAARLVMQVSVDALAEAGLIGDDGLVIDPGSLTPHLDLLRRCGLIGDDGRLRHVDWISPASSATRIAVQRERARRTAREIVDDEEAERRREESPPLTVLNVSDLARVPRPRPLIGGLLFRGTLAQISGPPGCFKSFLAVALACCVASGIALDPLTHPLHGGPGMVLYVAAEGVETLDIRIRAWCQLHGIELSSLDGRLFVHPEPIQLGDEVAVDRLVEFAEELRPDLVVIDTRARSTIGLEENSATDQSVAIAAADLVVRTGATVLGVHHSGRAGSTPRGSTAWDGAVWSDLRMTRENTIATVKPEKHKGATSGQAFGFRAVSVTVDRAEHMSDWSDDECTSLVLVPDDSAGSIGQPLADGLAAQVLEVLSFAPPEGMTISDILSGLGTPKPNRSSVWRALSTLANTSQITKIEINPRLTKYARYA